MDQTLFNQALEYALKAHEGVARKGSDIPFILHPMETAVIVASITEDQETIAAALLHDTVEDAGCTIEDLRERFGEKVAYLVASESENKRRDQLPEDSWQIRKEESLEELKNSDDIDVKILWLADKLSNIRSFYRLYQKKGDEMWKMFHQSDPEKQGWYYRRILELTKDLEDTQAHREYTYLVNNIFGEQQ